MKKQLIIILAGTVLIATANAQNTYNYSGALNLSSGTFDNIPPGFEYYNSPAYESFELFNLPGAGAGFTLNPGDTLAGTITFAGNQSILWKNQTAVDGYFDLEFQNPLSGTIWESTLTLLGVNGTSGQSSPDVESLEGTLSAQYFATPNSTVSFTGFSYSLTISDTATSSGPWTPYVFGIVAGPDDITIQAAPEPSSLAFWAGTAALIASCRKLRKQ
jgi:hypothetical protein